MAKARFIESRAASEGSLGSAAAYASIVITPPGCAQKGFNTAALPAGSAAAPAGKAILTGGSSFGGGAAGFGFGTAGSGAAGSGAAGAGVMGLATACFVPGFGGTGKGVSPAAGRNDAGNGLGAGR